MTKTLLATAALAISTSASAVTYEYGSLLSGSYIPAESFASLTVIDAGNVYDVTFNVFDLNSIFTQDAFIGAVAINSLPGNNFIPAISNISGDAPVAVSPGNGPTAIYETRFDFSDPQQSRLTANESVSFTATFSNTVELDIANFAVHVQGLTDAQGGSAWYVASPIPEPETYAMFLAGLALIGFMAKKAKRLRGWESENELLAEADGHERLWASASMLSAYSEIIGLISKRHCNTAFPGITCSSVLP